ncbi:MAG: hypothetical protein P1P65_01745, partial [Treponema sp.]
MAAEKLKIGYQTGDSKDKVRQNLTLPKTVEGFIDVKITWTSNNESVISHSGVVTRLPQDETVILTATLEKQGIKPVTKTFQLRVVKREAAATDSKAVQLATEALQIGFTGDDRTDHVTKKLTLHTVSPSYDGVTIAWTSSLPGIIAADGTVTRPQDKDTPVKLTARLTKGSAADEKIFTVTVIKLPPAVTDRDIVENAAKTLEITFEQGDTKDSVTKRLMLPTVSKYYPAVTIRWTSMGSLITDQGIVTRPDDKNTAVTLTATLSKGAETQTVSFTVIVQQSDKGILESAKESLKIGYISGNSENRVTKKLTLPKTIESFKGVTVTWHSGDTAVISDDGTVTRPQDKDTQVTLTATLKKSSATDTKQFTVIVAKLETAANDTDAVAGAKAALEIVFAENDSAHHVTNNVTLPAASQDYDGVGITWASSEPAVIAANGTVTRQAEDKRVTLTATLKKGSTTDTKEFIVTVLQSDQTAVEKAAAKLEIGYKAGDKEDAVTQDVTLPTMIEGFTGVEVAWQSSKKSVIGLNGSVTRLAQNETVTLTATLEKGSGKTTKQFTLTVLQSEQGFVAKAAAKLEIVYQTGDNASAVTKNLMLPTAVTGFDGVTVTWASNNEAVISPSGTVTRK